MELQVGRLMREQGRTQVFTADEPCPPDLLEAGVEACRGPVHIEGRATSTGAGVLVQGRVTVPVTMVCSRCLSPYPLELEAEFEEEFVPRSRPRPQGEDEEATAEGRNPVAGDEDEVEYFDNHRIDLGPLIREQLLMALPMKSLCRDDCRGLCPVCGHNLNLGACDCQVDETDPRLAVLRELLNSSGEARPGRDE
ncbi:MAG TPA: DUF177 domain-containing protein [Limnochorda sp.]